MGSFRERLRIKVSSGCVRTKLFTDYYKNRFNEDGLDHYCKSCRIDFNSEWSAKHRDKRYLAQWRYRNKQLKKINV